MRPRPRRLLLLGAGHTHVLALPRIACAAHKHGVEVTIASNESVMPYSGMLPGVVADLYPKRAMLIDAAALADRCGVDFVNENAIDLDARLRQVRLTSGLKLNYDYLSINIGGDSRGAIAEEGGDVMPVKPALPFLHWLEQWQNTRGTSVAVVGAGVAGVEIALALDARLRGRGRRGGVYLVGSGSDIIPGLPRLAPPLRKLLARQGISQLLGQRAVAAYPGALELEDGSEHHADRVVLCTGVRPWNGLAAAGLDSDGRGFPYINQWLQSVSHPDIFLCGDCASWHRQSLPKSGVFAVRQAHTLAVNMAALCAGEELRTWDCDPRYLSIIGAGRRYAIAHRAGRVVKGRWVWYWKDYLDRGFMRGFAARSSSPRRGSRR